MLKNYNPVKCIKIGNGFYVETQYFASRTPMLVKLAQRCHLFPDVKFCVSNPNACEIRPKRYHPFRDAKYCVSTLHLKQLINPLS
jgi:hypothetical protein